MTRAITTVYSYYFPEVQALVSDVVRDYPHHVFLRSVAPGLDDFHVPIIDKLVAYHAASVPALSSFPHRYPTAGAEEAIREHLTDLARDGVRRIAMWEGDYEGYREVARTRGIDTVEVPFGADPRSVAPMPWFLSNPSARDGNIVPDEAIAALGGAGHRLFYDLSYLGSTPPHLFDVSSAAVDVVALSLSKPYGLFYYRQGFAFSRKPVTALYANKWFKNVLSLLIAERIFDHLPVDALARRYKPVQDRIVRRMRDEEGLPVRASDALLLAHARAGEVHGAALDRFRRAGGHRFCLTPYYLSP